MLFDRDIDRKMVRTSQRPLAAGRVNSFTATYLGAALVISGLLWAAVLSSLFFVVILAGAGLNVLVYTLWLKRRSAWSILWGGLAGGMPILAGRVLALGRIEALGLMLGLAIVVWIPSHNLTLGTLYSTDYLNASVPTLINRYGLTFTRRAVALSSVLTALLIVTGFIWLNSPILVLALQVAISFGLVGLALFAWTNPSQKLITTLYKYSSIYMLVSMLLLALIGLK
jgi:protoheme IX farnesyltransferase